MTATTGTSGNDTLNGTAGREDFCGLDDDDTCTGSSLTLTGFTGQLQASTAGGGGVELTLGATIIPALPTRPATPNVSETIWIYHEDYTVSEGMQLYGQDVGFIFDRYVHTPSHFTNNGFIWSESTSYPGIVADGFGHVTNNGTAVAVSTAGQLVAFSGQGLFENNGSIFAIATGGAAFAIHDYSPDSMTMNRGLIAASSEGQVYAIRKENGGPVHNLGDGQILAEGAYATAIMVFGGTIGTADEIKPLEIVNEGLIEAVATADGEMSYGLGAVHGEWDRFEILNSGTIRADYAIYISSWPGGDGASETVTNLSTGWLDGRVNLERGDDTLVNSGRISGLVELGEGNDKFLGSSGTTSVTVDGGDGDDLLEGGTAGDQLAAGDGSDIIEGGAGADTLSGGLGNDLFSDTVAGLSGDTITDLAVGDKIVITDATLASFTFGLTGNTLTFSGGSLTFGNALSGHLFASAAAGGGVELSIVKHDPESDFNGDGRSDILGRNEAGALSQWLAQADGLFAWNPNAAYQLDTSWKVIGFGDFNGDSRDDIMWQHDNGNHMQWLAQPDGGFAWNPILPEAMQPGWHLIGIADFNGDGRDDMIWQTGAGTLGAGMLTEWLGQSDGSFVSNPAAQYSLSTDWQAAGVGDFNGDGIADIMWRNEVGAMSEWLGQSDGTFAYNPNAAYQLPTNWEAAATGDFNGDGRDDIMWRNEVGAMSEWLAEADGTFAWNPNAAYQLPTNWEAAATGDFNGDGRDDILWRNEIGAMSQWLAQADGAFAWNPNADYQMPANWEVQPDYSL